MASRIYKVTDSDGNNQAIKATNPAQAIRHAARGKYTATVATQDDLVSMVSAGTEIQDATKEQPDQ